mgnify:CR=1 FL=1
MMRKSARFCAVLLALSLVLLAAALLLRGRLPGSWSGVLIGLGAGIFGASLSGLLMRRWESRNPEFAKQNEIDSRDERTTAIRSLAKARAGDVVQWCVMGIAWLSILAEAPLWLTLAAVGVFLLYSVLSLAFMIRLEKEM